MYSVRQLMLDLGSGSFSCMDRALSEALDGLVYRHNFHRQQKRDYTVERGMCQQLLQTVYGVQEL